MRTAEPERKRSSVGVSLRGSGILGSGFLHSVHLTLGCATVVTPLTPQSSTLTESNHGLVLGRIHLTWNGKYQRAGQPFRFDENWRITEESIGTQFLVDHLPVDGLFVLELPRSSYRLTVVSFDSAL
jgi:hypothetical protein